MPQSLWIYLFVVLGNSHNLTGGYVSPLFCVSTIKHFFINFNFYLNNMKKYFSYLVVAAMLFSAVLMSSCDDETKLQEFTVTFDTGGGSAVASQTVKEGERATEPTPLPTRDGYTFVGWLHGNVEWNFETVVTADMTLTARWREVEKNGNGDGGIKLLETWSGDGGGGTKFEYDDQNRISRILHFFEGETNPYQVETLTYDGYDLVMYEIVYTDEDEGISYTTTIVYVRNGNTITITQTSEDSEEPQISTMILSNNGLPVRHEHSGENWSEVTTYEFQGFNLTNITEIWNGETRSSANFKYDSNKSPFYYCTTPKWFLIMLWGGEIGFHNNIIEASWDWGKVIYTYVFEDGLPIKMTGNYEDEEGEEVFTFTYITR